MSVSRRRFLELGSLFVAATAIPSNAVAPTKQTREPAPGFPAQTQSEVVSLSSMSKDTFARLVGSTFVVRDPAGKFVSLVLMSVDDTSAAPKSETTVVLRVPNPAKQIKRTNSFALRFRSVSGKALSQGTYSFSTAALGTFALFIVPAAASQPYCTAVFSR